MSVVGRKKDGRTELGQVLVSLCIGLRIIVQISDMNNEYKQCLIF